MIRKRRRYRLTTTRFIRRERIQRSGGNIRRWWTRYSLHFEGISQIPKNEGAKFWTKTEQINVKRQTYFIHMLWDFFVNLKENLFTLARHLPGEIYRCCEYFLEYNGKLDATVRSTKFHWSPLPQGGLEISIKLPVGEKKR